MCGFASHGHGCTYCIRVVIEDPLATQAVLAFSADAGEQHEQGDLIVDYCIPIITTVPPTSIQKLEATMIHNLDIEVHVCFHGAENTQ